MNYSIAAKSSSENQGLVVIDESHIAFGIDDNPKIVLPNPAELLLGSLAACILKSVERFSVFMKFRYTHADIDVSASRTEKPPRLDEMTYVLKIYSEDRINVTLLQKNIEQYGTIFNTIKSSCQINGSLTIVNDE